MSARSRRALRCRATASGEGWRLVWSQHGLRSAPLVVAPWPGHPYDAYAAVLAALAPATTEALAVANRWATTAERAVAAKERAS